MNKLRFFFIFTVLFLFLTNSHTEEKVSLARLKPVFTKTKHIPPEPTRPPARSLSLENFDVIVLFLSLSMATYIALYTRSRRQMLLLTIFSLLYFGLWKRGCICSVGSIQNISLAIINPNYPITWHTVAFFILPLLFAILFGRVFCSAVCPFGAIQELVVFKPFHLPKWINNTLRFIPYTYLAVSIVIATAGGGFIICRYDPFVSFFRMNGELVIVVAGISILVVGVFFARPYCRFICPYGVILSWISRVSFFHVKIAPDECIQCRLCENACPYDSIEPAVTFKAPEPRLTGTKRLLLLIIAAPFIISAGVIVGNIGAYPLSMSYRNVYSAIEIEIDKMDGKEKISKEAKDSINELLVKAESIQCKIKKGMRIAGGFLGSIVVIKLIGISIWRRYKDYEPNRATCFSCTRCFISCPKEHQRIKKGGDQWKKTK